MVEQLFESVAGLVLLCACAAGCSTIDYRQGPVPGLENLAIEEHHVEATEIYFKCATCGNLPHLMPTACTCINFRTRRAVIWLAHGASAGTIEHERAHARGYDHSDGQLRQHYAAWVQSRGRTDAR
jgi:hypothetical protein